MSQTYQTTGIILKGMPFQENDRLVTILSPDKGLISAIAPGARKYQSRLRGRTELFVENNLFLVKGKSIDKITQIESINTHSGLSQDLAKLSAAQYLAELSLCLATVEQEEKELYQLCKKLFCSLEQIAKGDYFTVIVNLAYGVFHHLQIAGIVPQLDNCCLSQKPVFINSQLGGWQVGFSFEAGGIVNLSDRKPSSEFAEESVSALIEQQESCKIDYRLNSLELKLLKHLKENNLSDLSQPLPLQFRTLLESAWLKIERLLREYTRYHLGCKLRSAELLDTLDPVQF